MATPAPAPTPDLPSARHILHNMFVIKYARRYESDIVSKFTKCGTFVDTHSDCLSPIHVFLLSYFLPRVFEALTAYINSPKIFSSVVDAAALEKFVSIVSVCLRRHRADFIIFILPTGLLRLPPAVALPSMSLDLGFFKSFSPYVLTLFVFVWCECGL
jgi:hypothetical protein